MEFDLKELIAKAHFDYVGPAFPNWWGKNKTKLILPSLNNISRELLMGGRYFQTLKVAYKGEQFVFPNEPLISLSSAKTIVDTPTVGKERKGAVLEYICTENFQIQIRGVCVNEDADERDDYPADQVREVQRMYDINDSLEVINNPFLELFNIRNIVFKNIEWDEMSGQQGLQKFTISAVSDQDFYADLSEKEKTKLLS